MSQIFHPSSNIWAKASIVLGVLAVLALGWSVDAVVRSPAQTEVNVARQQPVPFSHEHHVKRVGLDCRYCHTSVEDSSFAGIPPSKTCMNCHSQLFTNAAMLEPVRESFRTGEPLEWTRVHNLADFVQFNHSIHVSKGVGCVTCHGDVGEMPIMWKDKTLFMQWCLECHRNPEKFVRPPEEVFNLKWRPEDSAEAFGLEKRHGPMASAKTQEELGKILVERYHIQKLTNCSACHR